MSNKNYSNSITLVRVADGKSANSYFIETNYDEILRFETSNELVFSPDILHFKVLDFSKDDNNASILDFNWEISYLSDTGYESIDSKKDHKYPDFFNYSLPSIEDSESQQEIETIEEVETSYEYLYFYISNFYKFLKNKTKEKEELELFNLFNSGSLILKFSYIEEGFTRAEKILIMKNGVSNDMAQLNIGAAGIVASMREASLQFDANGLRLNNGHFSIYQEYEVFNPMEETTDATPVEGKEYYYINEETGDYELAGDLTQFDEEEVYYIRSTSDDIYTRDNGNYNKHTGTLNANTLYYRYINEPIFYMDEKTGNLTVKGDVHAENGYFKGEVQATSGTFNGNINASGGTIGGFKISSEEQGDTRVDYLQSIDGNIILNGTKGEIIAENITLGAGAKISKSIEFTNIDGTTSAKILNPQDNNNLWLSAGQIALYTDGRLDLGTIELNSGTGKCDGYIRSKFIDLNDQSQDGHWRINENGTAQFKNIYADEVHLQNSILEIGTIQNVGSLMLFKDAWSVVDFGIVKDSNENTMIKITLDKSNTLAENDWIFSNDRVYKVLDSENKEYYELIDEEMKLAVQYIEGKVYYEKLGEKYEETSDEGFYSYIYIESNTFEGNVITKFGRVKENSEDEDCDYVISIFGESKKGPDIRDFATPNSLTISSFNIIENGSDPIVNYTKHLILGDLSSSGLSNLQGQKFGLYADNVFLTGSLTTQMKIGDNNFCYAGVNTKSPVAFNIKNETIEDNSPIIFWSGAQGQIDTEIQKAPFQVTTNGTLYASQAIIENSVVAGADIYGSRIYAAELHGWKEGQSGELAIYDSSKGIVFKKEEQKTILFSIKGDGFYQSNETECFINLKNSIPLFIGDFQTKPNDNSYLKISGNSLNFYNDRNQLAKIVGQIDNSNGDQSYIDFQFNGNDSIFELRATKIEAKKDVYINNNMEMGSHTMTYKIVSDGNDGYVGYDLYVY